MTTDYAAYEKGRLTRQLMRVKVQAYLKRRQPEPREEQFVWERHWGFWRKRPTLNTMMSRLPPVEVAEARVSLVQRLLLRLRREA